MGMAFSCFFPGLSWTGVHGLTADSLYLDLRITSPMCLDMFVDVDNANDPFEYTSSIDRSLLKLHLIHKNIRRLHSQPELRSRYLSPDIKRPHSTSMNAS
jgi:hypothetical protein